MNVSESDDSWRSELLNQGSSLQFRSVLQNSRSSYLSDDHPGASVTANDWYAVSPSSNSSVLTSSSSSSSSSSATLPRKRASEHSLRLDDHLLDSILDEDDQADDEDQEVDGPSRRTSLERARKGRVLRANPATIELEEGDEEEATESEPYDSEEFSERRKVAAESSEGRTPLRNSFDKESVQLEVTEPSVLLTPEVDTLITRVQEVVPQAPRTWIRLRLAGSSLQTVVQHALEAFGDVATEPDHSSLSHNTSESNQQTPSADLSAAYISGGGTVSSACCSPTPASTSAPILIDSPDVKPRIRSSSYTANTRSSASASASAASSSQTRRSPDVIILSSDDEEDSRSRAPPSSNTSKTSPASITVSAMPTASSASTLKTSSSITRTSSSSSAAPSSSSSHTALPVARVSSPSHLPYDSLLDGSELSPRALFGVPAGDHSTSSSEAHALRFDGLFADNDSLFHSPEPLRSRVQPNGRTRPHNSQETTELRHGSSSQAQLDGRDPQPGEHPQSSPSSRRRQRRAPEPVVVSESASEIVVDLTGRVAPTPVVSSSAVSTLSSRRYAEDTSSSSASSSVSTSSSASASTSSITSASTSSTSVSTSSRKSSNSTKRGRKDKQSASDSAAVAPARKRPRRKPRTPEEFRQEMHLRMDLGFSTDQRVFKELVVSLRADLSVDSTRMPLPYSVVWYRIDPCEEQEDDEAEQPAGAMGTAEDPDQGLTCEDHLTLVRTGKQLIEMVEHNQLRPFFLQVQEQYPTYRLNLLVQGLEAALRQRRSHANRQHRDVVVGTSGGRDEDVNEVAAALRDVEALRNRVQRALVWLQVEIHCHVAHAPDYRETEAILRRYTDSLAEAPYRRNPRFANFCGKVSSASGKTPEETWMLQLKDVPGVSEKRAKAIARVYPTLGRLLREYRDPRRGVTEKAELLQHIQVNNNRTHATVGAAISRKLYQLLTATDPSFTVA